MDVYYFYFQDCTLIFRILRTCCVSLKLSYFSLWGSKTEFLTSSSVPLCTIGIGFELSWSSCQNFDWTVKFVAQIFDENSMGMVPYVFLELCMTGIYLSI